MSVWKVEQPGRLPRHLACAQCVIKIKRAAPETIVDLVDDAWGARVEDCFEERAS